MTYAERETSIAGGQPFELYRFLTESRQWRMTSGDKDRTYQGQVYRPEAILRTAASQSTEEKGGHIKVTLAHDADIARLFVSFIPSTPLYLTIFRGHDGDAGIVVAFTGRVMSAQFTTEDTCELDCAPESELLKRRIASAVFQKPCNHILFDTKCGIDRELWRISAVLQSVSANGLTLQAAAFATKPNGWWSTGYIEFNGDRRMVIAHAGNQITLMTAMPGMTAGMTISIYPGCDRTYDGAQGCQAKFTNGVKFSGYQWIPRKNPFSSGVS